MVNGKLSPEESNLLLIKDEKENEPQHESSQAKGRL